jgi:hypothetical protein
MQTSVERVKALAIANEIITKTKVVEFALEAVMGDVPEEVMIPSSTL